MKLFKLLYKESQGILATIIKAILTFVFFLAPTFLFLFDMESTLFLFIGLIALYPLFNIITFFPFSNNSVGQKGTRSYFLLFLIFAFSHTLLSIYLWLVYDPSQARDFFIALNLFMGYLSPYLIATALLLSVNSLNKKPKTYKIISCLVIFIGIFFLQFLANLTPFVHYINILLLISLFICFTYLSKRKQPVIDFSYNTHLQMLFSLTSLSEIILTLDRLYNLSSYFVLLFVFTTYIFITIELHHFLIKHYLTSSTKQLLYKKNSDLMDKFLALKNLELQHLESEMMIKDHVYKQLFDFAPDAFVIFTDEGISYANTAFATLVDSKDASLVMNKMLHDFIHPDCMEIANACHSDLMSGAKDVCKLELQLLSFTGKVKDVRVSASITLLENIHYIFCSFHDLTAHYQQERLKLKLENDIAQEKFKVRFFANISHDLKTPINVIYSAVQLQDIYILSSEYGKVVEYNNIVKQNCLRLQKLLNDILDITKIDSNYLTPQLELCNIICTIEYITDSVISYVENKNITITFDTNVEDKFVMTDPNLIERIILNLVSNAIKYGRQDGDIWLTLHDTGDHLIISVKDNGIGIPPSHLPKIFNRFHKTDSKVDRNVSGNGIGLSLVKSIVDILEGTIFCLSTENIGSEFIIILPMLTEPMSDVAYCEYATSLDLANKLNIELSDI